MAKQNDISLPDQPEPHIELTSDEAQTVRSAIDAKIISIKRAAAKEAGTPAGQGYKTMVEALYRLKNKF